MAELTLLVPSRYLKALLAMVPPLLLPPLFGGEDNACSTHANSSLTALACAVCWALKARASLVRTLRPILQAAKTANAMGATKMATPAATTES